QKAIELIQYLENTKETNRNKLCPYDEKEDAFKRKVALKIDSPNYSSTFQAALNDLCVSVNIPADGKEAKKEKYANANVKIQSIQDQINKVIPPTGEEDLPPFDRRIVEYLIYLVMPVSLGGAGHENIRVSRIWRQYNFDDEKRNISKETENATNVSAHNDGQACDIESIDFIKCSKWSFHRIGGVKTKKQKPRPIYVNYQTPEGAAGAGNPMFYNFNEMFRESAYQALLGAFGDTDMLNGENDDTENLQGASLSDILNLVGQQLFQSILADPQKALTGEGISSTIENVGKIFLADELSIDREAFLYTGDRDLVENIGRYEVEKKIGLIKGSLSNGNKSDELLKSVGTRHIENIFDFPTGALKDGLGGSKDAFSKIIGQNIIASKLNIPAEYLKGNKKSDWEKALGKTKFDLVFAEPLFVDEMLALEYGTTKSFLKSKDMAGFKKKVGENDIENRIGPYSKHSDKSGTSGGSLSSGSLSMPSIPLEDNSSKGDNLHSRNEAFGMPTIEFLNKVHGKPTVPADNDFVEKMLNGDNSILPNIGAYQVSMNVVPAVDDSVVIYKYLIDPSVKSIDSKLDDAVRNKTGLKKNEFQNIFKDNAAISIFKKYGEKAVLNGIRTNPEIEQAEADAIAEAKEDNPELWGTIEFRLEKTKEAQRKVADMKSTADALEKTTKDPTIKNLIASMKTELDDMIKKPSINNVIDGGEKLDKLNGQLQTELDKPQNKNAEKDIKKLKSDAEELTILIREIISGEPYKTTRNIDTSSNSKDIKQPKKLTSSEIRELIDIFNNKTDSKNREERLLDLSLRIGSRQLDYALDLPEGSFYYIYTNKVDSEEGFFQAVGQAKFEEVFDKKISGTVINTRRGSCYTSCSDSLAQCYDSPEGINDANYCIEKNIACATKCDKDYPDTIVNAQSIIRSSNKSRGGLDYDLHLDNGTTDKYVKGEMSAD
ncbi:MAG: hypothetical protein CEN91_495, partial [Candidatus Berkelbacteria bacterium Licking1014_85]